MNKSFFRGILAGSILGAIVGMFSAPQKKLVRESAPQIMESSVKMRNGARRVFKGISKGMSDMMKRD